MRSGAPRPLGHLEACIDHVRRCDQLVLQKEIEGLATDPLDDEAEHVEAEAVVPDRAG
jgi:hypothetical protein